MSDEFDVQNRWPELFEQLSPQQSDSVARALEHARSEGRTVTRQEVVDLIDETRGAVPPEEYVRRDMPPQ
ncbi:MULTISPECIES: hypothetical protein [Actinomycetes]|jgi:hypothetical protein|uniref:Antitoxin VbhA domain-containing protein n=2 Tax=Acidipropionibacterium TaxID=1912215 RepID=A0A3S4V293_9ACTN|nr:MULTISPECIES: hypothetical protein [Actinomycetes]AMS05706.1 hypothetical protein AXH35_09850 [Acidipropionibacterium acidipropionici]AOZ47172.1 hypothetical protein A8L58_11290 [Acidipropionibacterium acidipropionici]AZP36724.1 hypothetical protein DUY81_01895 [Acidipropionibacterium acidipropionici]AZZ40420.1 hypothetical protein C0Z10_12475 [Acidipropionibacterium jensenii]AZZ42933.1 hypothetical protein C0Z11_12215 [Acidipropionibacterium jensenii]